MDEICEGFEDYRKRRDRGCTDVERRDFERHLENCSACRDQCASEEVLLGLFSETAPPGLSPLFNEQLRRRISVERAKRSRRSFLMQAYWLTAFLISTIIFLNTAGENTDVGAAMLLILFCFSVPTLLLGRMFRLNLFDLILSTMNHPEKRVESFRNGYGA